MIAFRHDIPVAVRLLAKSPAFTAVAATLALGIGATTAISSLIDAVLLARCRSPRPKAGGPPVWLARRLRRHLDVAYADHRDWRAAGFFAASAVFSDPLRRTGGPASRSGEAATVSRGFFAALGVKPSSAVTPGPRARRGGGGGSSSPRPLARALRRRPRWSADDRVGRQRQTSSASCRRGSSSRAGKGWPHEPGRTGRRSAADLISKGSPASRRT